MFSNSRPVPSKAALKVLYQLAYISSGTAVGVATLCAEERRRRTLLVQKIADNAKRIRQSPRYVHNKAREAVDEAEERYVPVMDVGEGHSGKGTRLLELDPGDRAVRGPELPSVVDSGYEQLVQRSSHRVRRQRAKASRQSSNAREDGYGREAHSRSRFAKRVPSEKIPRLVLPETIPSHDDTLLRKHVKSRDRLKKPAAQGTQDQLSGRRETPSFITLRFGQARRKRHVLVREGIMLNSKNIKHDIDLLLEQDTWAGDPREQHRVATVLLRLACQKALLVESRRLIAWLASREAMTQASVVTVCESSCGMALGNPSEVRRFYLDLFSMLVSTRQPMEFRTQVQVAAVIGILRSSTSVEELHLMLTKTGDRLPQELKTQYDKLCSIGEHALAARLLHVALETPGQWEKAAIYAGTIDHAVASALSRGDLASGVNMFRRKLQLCVRVGRDKQQYTNVGAQLDHLCQVADQHQQFGRLSPMCDMLGRYPDKLAFVLAEITPNSKVTLAIASSVMERSPNYVEDLAKALRHSLPAEIQIRLIDAQLAHQLKKTWRTTRNLPAVFAQYDQHRRTQVQPPTRKFNLGPADIALVEVCNLAEQPHRALQILTPKQNHGLHSRDSFSLAALTLAGMEAWETLEALIQVAAKSRISIVSDPSAMGRLDKVVHLYARQHDAAQTWVFITSLIQRIDFKPIKSTTKTMLRNLVNDMRLGQPTLIPRWLEYLRSLDIRMELDSNIAVAMFRQYYRIYRIPHVLLMDLCRKLVSRVPSLQSIGWTTLVKQSIGYDLREVDTRRKSEMRLAAEHNLSKVMASSPEIPAPSKTWEFREQASVLRLPLLPASQETGGAQQVEVAMDNGLYQQFDQLTNSHGAFSKAVQSDDNLLGQASPQPSDPYHKLIEAFYSDDCADVGHGDTHASPRTVVATTASGSNHVGPLDVAGLSHSALEQHQSEELDVQALTESNDMLRSKPSMDQEKIGYSGFDSSYRARQRVTEMVLALSRRRHEEVLDLYEASLGDTGLPLSPIALAVAVQAHIHRDGGSLTGAKDLLEAARSAGFDVTCAMGPVLMREMRMLQPQDKRKANDLRVKVVDYYRANDENGWPVSHHVGVTAANLLIDNHRPEYGINLLDSIYKSEWSKRKAPDIVAMTVFLKGYIALKSLPGIMWSVRKVLNDGIRPDRRFLHYLRVSPRAFDSRSHLSSAERLSVNPSILRQLRKARAVCAERRLRQRVEAKQLGNKLIRAIALAVRAQQQPTEERASAELRKGHFGQTLDVDDNGVVTSRPVDVQSTSLDAAEYPRTYMARRRRARSALRSSSTNAKSRHPSRRMSARAQCHQLRKAQYRSFRRAGLTTPDGQPISFRSYLAIRAAKRKLRTCPVQEHTQLSGIDRTEEDADSVESKHAASKDVDQTMYNANQDHVTCKPLSSGAADRKISRRPSQPRPGPTDGDIPWLESLKDVQAQRSLSLGRGVTLPPAYYMPMVDEHDTASTTEKSTQSMGRREFSNDETESITRYRPIT